MAALEDFAARVSRWGATRSSAVSCGDAARALASSGVLPSVPSLRRRGSAPAATAAFREALAARRGEGGGLASPILLSKTLHWLASGEFPVLDKVSRAALGIALEGGLSHAAAFRLVAQWEYAFLREAPAGFEDLRQELAVPRLRAVDAVLRVAWEDWLATHRRFADG